MEFVFQVRLLPKNTQGFAPAAALCWIVRFAASLSSPRQPNLHLATLVPSAPAGQTLHGWRRERSWRLDRPADRLCATAQCAAMESKFFSLAMPPSFREWDPDVASRLELQLLRPQLDARRNCGHTTPRALTFDMRGAQKAEPFGHPLDGRVRRLLHRCTGISRTALPSAADSCSI